MFTTEETEDEDAATAVNVEVVETTVVEVEVVGAVDMLMELVEALAEAMPVSTVVAEVCVETAGALAEAVAMSIVAVEACVETADALAEVLAREDAAFFLILADSFEMVVAYLSASSTHSFSSAISKSRWYTIRPECTSFAASGDARTNIKTPMCIYT